MLNIICIAHVKGCNIAPIFINRLIFKSMKNQVTKSGHVVREQNCFNEYKKEDNKTFAGYEYFVSDSAILYVYEDGELVDSKELRDYSKKHRESVVQYFINQLKQSVN